MVNERHVVGVVSGKGGVGKSTIAVNIATLLTASGVETLLIDGDTSNPSVGLHLGIWQHSYGLQDVLEGRIAPEEAIVLHPATGVRIIPSSIRYVKGVKMGNLSKVVRGIKVYRHVTLDSPPGLNDDVENIIRSCTELLVVTTPDVPSVTSAAKIIDISEELRVPLAGVVVNRIMNRRYELHMSEIESLCNTRIVGKIPEDVRVPESIAAKIPVAIYAPKSPASIALQQLASEVSGVRIKPIRSGGIFSRLLEFFRSMLGR